MDDLERAVRRLRKKLRQIEHLESLHRDLNDEEALKVRLCYITCKCYLNNGLFGLFRCEIRMS